jgi:hypothetical protein
MAARGLICASVMAEDGAGLLAAVAPVVSLVDVVEIRLDGMRDPLIAACIASLAKPVLVTQSPGLGRRAVRRQRRGADRSALPGSAMGRSLCGH